MFFKGFQASQEAFRGRKRTPEFKRTLNFGQFRFQPGQLTEIAIGNYRDRNLPNSNGRNRNAKLAKVNSGRSRVAEFHTCIDGDACMWSAKKKKTRTWHQEPDAKGGIVAAKPRMDTHQPKIGRGSSLTPVGARGPS